MANQAIKLADMNLEGMDFDGKDFSTPKEAQVIVGDRARYSAAECVGRSADGEDVPFPVQGYPVALIFRDEKGEGDDKRKAYHDIVLRLSKPTFGVKNGNLVRLEIGDEILVAENYRLIEAGIVAIAARENPATVPEIKMVWTGETKLEGQKKVNEYKVWLLGYTTPEKIGAKSALLEERVKGALPAAAQA